MNTSPRPPTPINFPYYPTEFQQVILEKSQNFVGRAFVFTAISNFLQHYDRGYFTIIGAPGSGKSVILAKYVTENPHVLYYNAQLPGKNRAEEFISTICTQIDPTSQETSLPSLLQQVSDKLEPQQKFIIAIDALDTVNRTDQTPGSNLFYLPRYLPRGVYFLLTRRPYVRKQSGLLIEAPSEILNLAEYP
ncbi:MAG: ATP-binding protein [Nostoc sp.]|uniref:ATP-binding protein n=1 Tax=Nostoc sp. TaxID=1180 RepID=UPI002FF8CF7A